LAQPLWEFSKDRSAPFSSGRQFAVNQVRAGFRLETLQPLIDGLRRFLRLSGVKDVLDSPPLTADSAVSLTPMLMAGAGLVGAQQRFRVLRIANAVI